MFFQSIAAICDIRKNKASWKIYEASGCRMQIQFYTTSLFKRLGFWSSECSASIFLGDDNWNFIASGKKIHLVGGAEGFLGNIHPGSVIVFPIDLSHGVPAISEGEQATQQLATRSPNGTNMDKLWTNKKH